MPTIDGSAVFGYGVICPPPAINPRRQQKANYPGLNGTEALDMGDQGAFLTVTGRLIGANAGAYAAALTALLSYYDGRTHTVVDGDGTAWPNAVFESIEWEGRGESDPTIGYSRRFTARFFLLTLG